MNRSSVNHRLLRWLPKWRMRTSTLRRQVASSSGTNTLGAPRSPSYLGISYSRMRCAEGVPRQLGDQPVILVEVVALVGEDDVGREVLHRLDAVLHRRPEIGQVAVAELVQDDFRARDALEQVLRAGAGLARPLAARAEHHPPHLERRRAMLELEQRPRAPQLDVVGMAAEGEDPQRVGARPR